MPSAGVHSVSGDGSCLSSFPRDQDNLGSVVVCVCMGCVCADVKGAACKMLLHDVAAHPVPSNRGRRKFHVAIGFLLRSMCSFLALLTSKVCQNDG